MKSWRDIARPIIEKILEVADAQDWDEGRIRRALFDAYPFGMRKYTPYRIWLDEIRRQRGKRAPKDRTTMRLFE